MLVSERLAYLAKETPKKIITSFQGRETSYKELFEQAKRLAGYFQSKGYEQEDIIAVYLINSDYFLTCYYACQLGGFTILPINTKLTAPEVNYIFKHSEAKALIYDTRLGSILNDLPETMNSFEDLLYLGEENTLLEVFNNDSLLFNERKVDENTTTVIFYTSGTTGKPKGVMLSAANVRATAKLYVEALELNSADRMQIVAPLFHCAASHVFSIPVIYAGGTVVIEEGFSPEQTMDTLEQEKITVFFGVPAMYSILLNSPKMEILKLTNLRLFTYGAA
ncbi:MAG: AMP-binding protein, partial [Psychrobacillus psychrotolerans]